MTTVYNKVTERTSLLPYFYERGKIMNVKYIKLGAVSLAIFLSFRFLLPLVLPFVLAYFFAKMLSPILSFFEEKLHWHHRVSVILVVLVVFLALAGFVGYIISLIFSQSMLLLQKLPVYEQMISHTLEGMCNHCDQMLELAEGTSYGYMETQVQNMYHTIGSDVLPKISGYVTNILHWFATISSGIFIFLISTLLILFDDTFPTVRGKLRPFATRLKKAGLAYIKSQSLILFIIATVISVGLLLMGNEYAVIFGVGIAIFDAFPVTGSGVILIPWAIIKIIEGNYYGAAILITVFAIAAFLREVLEPRLFGKELSLKSLYILISVYAGIKLFGIPGVLLGPIGLTVLKVVKDEIEKQEVA